MANSGGYQQLKSAYHIKTILTIASIANKQAANSTTKHIWLSSLPNCYFRISIQHVSKMKFGILQPLKMAQCTFGFQLNRICMYYWMISASEAVRYSFIKPLLSTYVSWRKVCWIFYILSQGNLGWTNVSILE